MPKSEFRVNIFCRSGTANPVAFPARPPLFGKLLYSYHMDNKYNIEKPKKPETKAEFLAEKIHQLVKKRDRETNPAAKQTLNAEITKLFAQYERLKL